MLMAYVPKFIEAKIAEGISGLELAVAQWITANVIEQGANSCI